MAMTKARCESCKEETEHRHVHHTAHGLEGTHMAGSEHFVCIKCGRMVFKTDPGAQQFKFVLDTE